MKSSFGRLIDLGLCIVVVVVITQVANLSANRLYPWVSGVDPDGAFAWATIHHLVQLGLTLVVAPILGLGLAELGFSLKNKSESLSLLRGFLVYFVVLVGVGHVVLFLVSPPPEWPHALIVRNVVGELAFKALLSGTAEEPLFRGLVIMVLYRSWVGASKILGFEISHAGLIATLLFAAAHIGFTVAPFAITWISPIQIGQALVLGLFYAVAFDRTGSLLTPVVAHNLANVLFTSIGMVWSSTGGTS